MYKKQNPKILSNITLKKGKTCPGGQDVAPDLTTKDPGSRTRIGAPGYVSTHRAETMMLERFKV